jgi:hypothetical protein
MRAGSAGTLYGGGCSPASQLAFVSATTIRATAGREDMSLSGRERAEGFPKSLEAEAITRTHSEGGRGPAVVSLGLGLSNSQRDRAPETTFFHLG